MSQTTDLTHKYLAVLEKATPKDTDIGTVLAALGIVTSYFVSQLPHPDEFLAEYTKALRLSSETAEMFFKGPVQ